MKIDCSSVRGGTILFVFGSFSFFQRVLDTKITGIVVTFKKWGDMRRNKHGGYFPIKSHYLEQCLGWNFEKILVYE